MRDVMNKRGAETINSSRMINDKSITRDKQTKLKRNCCESEILRYIFRLLKKSSSAAKSYLVTRRGSEMFKIGRTLLRTRGSTLIIHDDEQLRMN